MTHYDPGDLRLLTDLADFSIERITQTRRGAAHDAVVVASVAWQQSTAALRHILDLARSYGLDDAALADASGLAPAVVDALTAAVKAALAPDGGE